MKLHFSISNIKIEFLTAKWLKTKAIIVLFLAHNIF